jgi:tetratricopeptide (TPR) repeat protein
MSYTRFVACALACAVAFLGYADAGTEVAKTKASSEKIPITTKSDEAKQFYIKGRDLAEKLRATDARAQYEKAIAIDKDFALAYVGLANTSGTAKEFFDATTRAASLAPKVSEGERHVILGLEATMKGDPASTLSHYSTLVKLFPNDERAHTLLGNTFFGRQDYETAVKHLERAIKIDPSFSQPYNQLGYAYRFLNRYDDAEKTFQKYTELIPDDPNPYDSYAELLMKMGRFDDSIKNYQKALSIDPHFIASYVGIGNNYLYKGEPEKARTAFAKINEVARNTGERRQSHFWTAATYVHEGKTDKAIEEIKAGTALAKAENDAAGISGDLNQIGDILREAGQYDEALASYKESVAVLDKSQVPDEVKSAGRRNLIFEEGRVAALTNKLTEAKAKSAEYAKQVSVKKVPFEVRQQHELAGMVAQAEKRYAEAAAEFQQANQQDPRVLLMASESLKNSGKSSEAAKLADQAAKFNGLNFNYAFVRAKTKGEREAAAKTE